MAERNQQHGSWRSGSSNQQGGSARGSEQRAESSDLKQREYRDKEGNVHHHTREYMERHGKQGGSGSNQETARADDTTQKAQQTTRKATAAAEETVDQGAERISETGEKIGGTARRASETASHSFEEFLTVGRDNMEGVARASQAMLKGASELGSLWASLWNEQLTTGMEAMRSLAQSDNWDEALRLQNEFTGSSFKRVCSRALKSAELTSEMVTSSLIPFQESARRARRHSPSEPRSQSSGR
jgi:hypothetical protein